MRQHGAFAAPGGTAGVEDGRQVVRTAHGWRVLVCMGRSALQQTAAAVVAQCEHMLRAGSEGDL